MFREKNNKPNQTVKNVTSAGTAEPLSAASLVVKRLFIQCRKTNTNDIYLGDENVDSSNYQEVLPAYGLFRERRDVDLNKVYIDADTNGEGVVFWYEQY